MADVNEKQKEAEDGEVKALKLTPAEKYKDLAFAPKDMDDMLRFTKMITQVPDLVPKQYFGKPEAAATAIYFGFELGLPPMQALQAIMTVNGKPAIFGDHALGLVQASQQYETHKEWIEGEGDKMTAHAVYKRRGNPEPIVQHFSVADAKTAQLWGKSGPWTNYPRRMLQHRARGFALRDAFADVLKGLATVEEVRDYVDAEVVSRTPFEEPKALGTTAAPAAAAKPAPAFEVENGDGGAQEPLSGSWPIKEVKMIKADSGTRFKIIVLPNGEDPIAMVTDDIIFAKRAKECAGTMATPQFTYEKRNGEWWLLTMS